MFRQHPDWQFIAAQIAHTTNQSFSIENIESISGGNINSAFIIQSKKNSYFIKSNKAAMLPMFEAEAAGLKEISQTNIIKVPQVILFGKTNNNAFLVLEKLSLSSSSIHSDTQLGLQLADLHKIKQPQFGWERQNTIGSTKQINTRTKNWVSFFQQHRLGFQLSLAETNGHSTKLITSGEKLCQSLGAFFLNYNPQASLLHGDLWEGNVSATRDNIPVIYDPACYYGDREADIAMTELFGGFSSVFYNAYNESFPLDYGYRVRKNLYNLYHIINHLNLFGRGYQQQAQHLIDSLLSEIN